ncbi:MAG: hypothetical protein HYS05_09525 [Acidobacteria bacterium]|nr:hypothetical protein [Acidobacteriota bacterium]
MVASALLLPAPASAQSSQVDDLILLARAVPPEIAADTLIKLATGRSDMTPKARLALLDEAWALADNAQEPLKRHLVPGVDPNSRAGWLSRAFLLDLDRLSLRSRVLIGLVRDHPVDARNRFQTISVDVPPLTCRDTLAYDMETYYQTAAIIARQAFSAAERARGDHLVFLENLIYGLRSPAQVPPIATLLIGLSSRDELARLTGAFAMMLRGVHGDDRAFSYTMSWHPLGDIIEKLALQCKARGVQAEGLLDAYRSYLVRHMSQRRCGALEGSQSAGEDAVSRFNSTLRVAGYASFSELPPITKSDAEPASLENVDPPRDSSLATTARQLKSELGLAISARGSMMVPVSTRGMPPRRGVMSMTTGGRVFRSYEDLPVSIEVFLKLTVLKDRLATWRTGPRDDQEEYFQLKSGLYASLFDVTPVGPLSDEVLSDFVDLLAHHDSDRHSRAGWYVRVYDLLRSARVVGPTTLERVRQRLTLSGQPSLKAIVALSTTLERAGP